MPLRSCASFLTTRVNNRPENQMQSLRWIARHARPSHCILSDYTTGLSISARTAAIMLIMSAQMDTVVAGHTATRVSPSGLQMHSGSS